MIVLEWVCLSNVQDIGGFGDYLEGVDGGLVIILEQNCLLPGRAKKSLCDYMLLTDPV